MATYAFLTQQWIEAVRALRAEYEDRLPPPPVETRINVVITEFPHGEKATLHGHIDTTSGQPIIEEDHLEDPELVLTVDYETAKAAFVTRDMETLMAAFLGGKILVEGDAMVLMALQATPPPEGANDLVEMYERLNAMTH